MQGRIQGEVHPARDPPKIGKNMIFLRKIVIFHTKYPKYFRASLRSARFFKCAPLTWNPGSAPVMYLCARGQRSCICVLGVSILSLSTIFILDFGNLQEVWYFTFVLLDYMQCYPVLCVMFCRSLFVLLSFFLLAIVLSGIHRFKDSDYPFGIFKLFFKLIFYLWGTEYKEFVDIYISLLHSNSSNSV